MRLFCGGGTPNRNVQLSLLYTAVNSVSYGIWGYTVLSGFLQGMPGGDTARVGFAEGIQGALQAFAAVPAGFIADRMGRDLALKGSAVLGLVAVVALLLALTLGKDEPYQFSVMCIGLALFGGYQGASSAPLEALFHDSIESSARARVATTKYIISIACNGAGPLVSLLLFMIFGDHWSLSSLSTVMMVGVFTTVVPIVILFFPRDSDALTDESEPIMAESPRIDARMDARTTARDVEEFYSTIEAIDEESEEYERLRNAEEGENDEEDDEEVSLRERIGSGGRLTEVPPSAASMQVPLLESAEEAEKRRHLKRLRLLWVPRIVVTTDMISGLASGMTIRFFPLFFKDETGLSPSGVNLIFVVSPLLIAIFAQIAYKQSKKYGRVKVPLVANTMGILLLFAMYFMGMFGDQYCWKEWKIIVPIYLIRSALMNCTRPLRKALLMDFVAKDNRGFVNSLESISAFGWSGSAVIGGVITKNYGYGASFVVTAAVQGLAFSVYGTLLLFDVQ